MSANLSKTEYIAQGNLDRIELLISKGNIGEAGDELRRLKEKCKVTKGSIDEATIQYLSSKVAHENADYKTALDLAKKSFEIFRDSAENRSIGKILLHLSRVYSSLGDMDATESYARDALATFRRIRDRAGIFDCYNKLAWVLYVRGDYAKSAKYLKEAIESFRKSAGDNQKAAISLTRYKSNLARIYIRSGEWDEAADLLKACIDRNRLYNMKDSIILNLLSLGYLSTLRRSQRQAWYCLEEARQALEQESIYHRSAIIYKEYLGQYYLEFGEYKKAGKAIDEGIHAATEIAPDSALISQLLRYRAELALHTGDFDAAVEDAERALEIATTVGEKLEIASAHRILGVACHRRGESERGAESFRKSEELFSQLSNKFDKALALVDFARENFIQNSEYEYRQAQAHLVTARFSFEELEDRYHEAESWAVEAELHARFRKYDLALKAIEEAEELFGALGESKRTGEVRLMREHLENKLVDRALSPENEFLLFKNYLNEKEYRNVRGGSLTENLEVLAKRTDSDHAFLCLFNGTSDFANVLATVKYDDDRIHEACRSINVKDIQSLDGRPLMVTSSDVFNHNGLGGFLSKFGDATSIILLPLQITDQKLGVLMLQRDAAGLGGRFFGQRDIDFAVAFSDVIAFKAIEAEQNELAEDNLRLRRQLEESCVFPNVITRNEDMLRMLDRVMQVKDSPISILIEGETGSGKDLIAKTIHYNSIRAKKRFISVNCAALPETLLESELFGYKRGAFTGADRDKAGLFEEADGGTFFLDEIGEMPLSIQAKLLRVLEDQEVVRLGETTGRRVDVRVLSATNRDLKEAMESKTFRQDLYYRLSALTLRIPPLRERRDDVPLLIDHFIEREKRSVSLSTEVFSRLVEYDWPGNVRELENEIKKLTLLCDETAVVDISLLSGKFMKENGNSSTPDITNLDLSNQEFSLYGFLEDYERKFILKALQENGWIKKHAATSLQIPESTLRLKMKQYGIKKPKA